MLDICSNGQVQTQYTGLALYDGEWFYINKGKLDTKLAAYVEYDGGLFYVAAGRILKEVSGLAQDPNGPDWYFLAEGQAQTQYTGLAFYDGEWFYVINGKLAEDYTGSVEYDGATFDVVNGMVAKNGDVVVPTPAPEVTPEVTPIVTPEATPKATPQVTPEATPETTPTTTPEVTPEATPETTPTTTPEATPEVTPEVTPETTPTTTPEVTPETTPTVAPTPESQGIERCVVDGVNHNAYNIYELTDAEEALLDDIINACLNGDEKSAAEMIAEDEYQLLAQHQYKYDEDNYYASHILYKGYKIYAVRQRPGYDSREMTIIPVEAGRGFMLKRYKHDSGQETIAYAHCECKDGMFSGALFSKSETTGDNGTPSSYSEAEGFIKNGLADGRYNVRSWWSCNSEGEFELYKEMGDDFVNGKPAEIKLVNEGDREGFVCFWETPEYKWVNSKKVEQSGYDYSELLPHEIRYKDPEKMLFRIDSTMIYCWEYSEHDGVIYAYPY